MRLCIQFYFSMTQLQPNLIECLQIPYEFRPQPQHRFIANQLMQIDSGIFNASTTPLLSFFAVIPTPQQMQQQVAIHSVILSKNAAEDKFKSARVTQNDVLANICSDFEIILIAAADIQKCEALSWQSPEVEIKAIHQWPIFCQIQRKKLYDILRNCRIVALTVGETFYKEGDSIQNSYFLVRSGEFSFMRRDASARKSVELLKVRKGFLFSQDANSDEEQFFEGHIMPKKIVFPKFNYTVKCKSSQGLIYCIDYAFLDRLVANVCEDKVKEHLEHQLSYLEERSRTVQARRSLTAHLLAQPPQRVQSVQMIPFTAPLRSFSRQLPKKHEEIVVLDLFDKPSNYKTVRQSLPKRDKLFSKKQLKKLYPDPEQDESDALIWKKVKCERLKQITRPASKIPSRSQILFQFTKTTIFFEKHKKRMSLI